MAKRGVGSVRVGGQVGGVLEYCTTNVKVGRATSAFRVSHGAIHGCIHLFLSDNGDVRRLLSLPGKRLSRLFNYASAQRQRPSSGEVRLRTLLPKCMSHLSHGNVDIQGLFGRCRARCPSNCRLSSFGQVIDRCEFRVGIINRMRRCTTRRVCVSFTNSELRIISRVANRAGGTRMFITVLPFDRCACYRTM